MQMPSDAHLTALILGGVALVGLLAHARALVFYATGLRTRGTIIGRVERTDSDGDSYRVPQVRFRDDDGRERVFVCDHPRFADFPIGMDFEVTYSPTDPTRADLTAALFGLERIIAILLSTIIVFGAGLFLLVR